MKVMAKMKSSIYQTPHSQTKMTLQNNQPHPHHRRKMVKKCKNCRLILKKTEIDEKKTKVEVRKGIIMVIVILLLLLDIISFKASKA